MRNQSAISAWLRLTRVTRVCSSIAACRAVMRLLDFNCNAVYLHPISVGESNPPISMTVNHRSQKLSLTLPEVRVVTEHITMTEFPYVVFCIMFEGRFICELYRGSPMCSPYLKTERRQESSCADTQSMEDIEALSDKASFQCPPPQWCKKFHSWWPMRSGCKSR